MSEEGQVLTVGELMRMLGDVNRDRKVLIRSGSILTSATSVVKEYGAIVIKGE